MQAAMDDSVDGHAVMQVVFIDDTNTNIISISNDSSMRIWDVATGTHKREIGERVVGELGVEGETGGEQCVLTKGNSNQQTMGKYVIDTKHHLVRVREKVTSDQGTLNMKTVACFYAPSHIETLQCSGNHIRLDCVDGDVLHLRASFLTV